MDLNRLTVRARGALEGAHQQAVARNHQQIEPVHVLFALLGDPEGIVFPVLHALGVQPKTVRDRADAELDRIPKVYAQGVEPRFSPVATRMLTAAGTEAEALTDEYISTEHLLARDRGGRRRPRGADPAGGRHHARRDAAGARPGARQPARHEREPRGDLPEPREVRA